MGPRVALALFVVGWGGCTHAPSVDPECFRSEDCKSGQVCEQRRCVAVRDGGPVDASLGDAEGRDGVGDGDAPGDDVGFADGGPGGADVDSGEDAAQGACPSPCGECEACVGVVCRPAPDRTPCTPDTNPCTEDICMRGACRHDRLIANDCGTSACGSSPSGCFDCGTCSNSCDSCESGACVRTMCCPSCGECRTCVGTSCEPRMDGESCTPDSNNCTQDVCMFGVCTHSTPIANDCGVRECGLSASGCFNCGVCSDGALCDGDGVCQNPAPVLGALSPSSVSTGAAGFTLLLSGSGFVTTSEVDLAGTPLSTTPISQVELRAFVPASLVAAAGVYAVLVRNPAPGGGISATRNLTVNNPLPSLMSIAPNPVLAESGSVNVTLTGSGFVSTSIGTINGAPESTTFRSATELGVLVPATYTAAAGSVPIAVTNPSPGGGTSTSIDLLIENPNPDLLSITPMQTVAGGPAFTLTLDGSGFVSGSQATFDGTSVVTTFVSATRLAATVPASLIAFAGRREVTVVNSGPGGGETGPVSFVVTNNLTSPFTPDADCHWLWHFDIGPPYIDECSGVSSERFGAEPYVLVTSRNAALMSAISASGSTDQGWIETSASGPQPPVATVEMTIRKAGPTFTPTSMLGVLYENLETGGGTPSQGGVQVIVTNTGNLFACAHSSGPATGSPTCAGTASGAIADGVWYHVAATFSVTDGIAVFIEGVEVTRVAGAIAWDATNTTGWIGASRFTGNVAQNRFNGAIDEVRISDTLRY